jgi:hypothetical protein
MDEESDVMDLITQLEEVSTEAETVQLCRQLAKAAARSAEDRDTIGSFEGLSTLYAAVKRNNKAGEAMRAYMIAMPAFCHKSTVNRGIIRDDGALDEIVNRLLHLSENLYNAPGGDGDMPDMDVRDEDGEDLGAGDTAKADEEGEGWEALAVSLDDQGEAVAACIALEALCKANDGNKKAAARINAEFNEEELVNKMDDLSVPLFKSHAGALDALIAILETTADPKLKVVAFRALKSLTTDDDNRQLSCVPSAVENREHCTDEQHFPRMRKVLVSAMDNPSPQLAQVVLLVMKGMSWHQNRIHALVFEDKVLPKVIKTMHAAGQDVDTVYAVLVVLRQFCFSDDMKKIVAFDEPDCLPWCVSAIKKHTKNTRILEQAFGLFSNLALKMPKIAQHLAENCDLLSIAHTVMHMHPNNANLLRTVVQSMRNISKVEEVLNAIMESILLDDLRDLVLQHKDDPAWRDAVEISKTFLRELREDKGLRAAPQWNEFY